MLAAVEGNTCLVDTEFPLGAMVCDPVPMPEATELSENSKLWTNVYFITITRKKLRG